MRCHRCREPNAGLPSILRVTTISPRFRYLTLGQAFRLRRSRRFLSRFSPQRLRAWEWDCPLPERSSKPTRVRYGQRTRPGVAQCFTSVCRYQQRNAFETEASESDAVDGSSTGTSEPWMWALLRLPRFRGANHADDNDNRFRHRQVSFPGSRRRRWRPSGHSPPVEAPLRLGVLPEAVALSGRYRSLRLGAPLVARAPGTGSHRAVDPTGLCEALRQAAEERCG